MLVMPLRTPALNPSSPVLLRDQIVSHVEAAVKAGDVQPGERLPAVRDLADRWEAGANTITAAWAILQERGVLISVHGKGTFVAERQTGDGA